MVKYIQKGNKVITKDGRLLTAKKNWRNGVEFIKTTAGLIRASDVSRVIS